MRRRKLHHLLSLANHPIRPFQMVWPLSVAQGEREEQPLHERKVALHPLLDTALSELKGSGVLRIRQRRACVYVAGELVQDDDECEPSAWRVGPPVKLPPPGLFEEWGEQLGYLLADLWSSLKPAQNLLPEGLGTGIVAWGNQYERISSGSTIALDSLTVPPSLALCLPYFNPVCNLGSCQICSIQIEKGSALLPLFTESPKRRVFSETGIPQMPKAARSPVGIKRAGGLERPWPFGRRCTYYSVRKCTLGPMWRTSSAI